MSEQDEKPTQPSLRSAEDARTPSERRLDDHDTAIAELREKTGKHETVLETLVDNDRKQTDVIDGMGRAVTAIESVADEMRKAQTAAQQERAEAKVERAEAKEERVELQRLLGLLRSDVASIVSVIANAFKSPRNAAVVAASVVLGGVIFGFIFALMQQVFK